MPEATSSEVRTQRHTSTTTAARMCAPTRASVQQCSTECRVIHVSFGASRSEAKVRACCIIPSLRTISAEIRQDTSPILRFCCLPSTTTLHQAQTLTTGSRTTWFSEEPCQDARYRPETPATGPAARYRGMILMMNYLEDETNLTTSHGCRESPRALAYFCWFNSL